ncbi:DNA-binding response regulator [Pseudoclavibacter endophyticus]|uniref:Response regulator transcription factor n=1 Tax=Pseudoclavibacter endophyticus TaxID=1778590 RepID=A0A6H9WBQ4_9MICO|nr:response regulator transcription factor [Pseudoclavibacter endophyticus]KAB1648093.1 response regulator transcription factor [Pseudoclavibacter endophyticus]GGA69671.1 DNA-binding response regulator [Pseudoclavibacter endophyticus]
MTEANASIRILVVDDHPLVRAGLAGLIDDEADLEVVGEASTGEAAAAVARAVAPDVVLMDLRMPGIGGAEATIAVREAAPASRVLIVTSYDTDDEILSAIDAGASGYVLKSSPADEILEAVRRVAAGEVALAPTVAAKLLEQTRRSRARGHEPDGSDARRALSARETEVLRLVALGHSNAAIGRELFIGEATVKTHLAHIFEKLEVRDRTRAVTRAMELGLL